MRRFFIPNIPNIGHIDLDSDLKHRIIDVLRCNDGEELEVIDGKGRLAKAVVSGKGKNIFLDIKEVKDIKKEGRQIIVAVSVIRRERFDMMVEKAVELGADKIIPFVCERSRPYGKDAYDKLKDRWQRIADQALSQCKRLFRCNVTDVHELEDLIKQIQPNTQLFALDPYKEKGFFIPSLIKKDKDVLCVIGPEGGFTEQELKIFEKANFGFYVLTNNILRAETAVMYALSVINVSNVS